MDVGFNHVVWGGWVMVFITTFNNISVTPWRSALMVEETGVLTENHWLVASHWQTLSHVILYRVHIARSGTRTHNLVIVPDCTGSCKSNYHPSTMAPACSLMTNFLLSCFSIVWLLTTCTCIKCIFSSQGLGCISCPLHPSQH